jgi:uncharacterized protein YneF (UPF0154 family)
VIIMMEIWQCIVLVLIAIVVTAIVTFIIVRKLFAKQLKKNPPVNENMIRAMFAQMGRTPSEKQVRAVMKSMEDAR